MTSDTAARPITGRKVLFGMVGFFGVVVAVNLTMATLAVGSFTGVVVDNGYVASQQFNRWIARGEAEAAIGWTAAAGAPGGVPEVVVTDALGHPLAGASVTLHLHHPLRADDARRVTLAEAAPGRYAAAAALPRGQWEATIAIAKDGRAVHVRDRLLVQPK
ncbi:MAG: FixH family protein [Alphaproteobacteria bacterium]|nr:FixH family protein [Alphaproteobacteria bacterium]